MSATTDPATTDPATFVLVPGAGGDGWYWHRVVPLLVAAGHRAVAVDLPAADPEAGLARYAEVIIDAAAGAPHVVVVAQSMGGLSAPLACGALDADRLVLLNAMVPLPGETGGEWWTTTAQEEARSAMALEEGRDPEVFDVLVDFMHDLDGDVVDLAMARGDRDQADRPFADPWPLDAWPDVPTLLLAAADDRLFPLDLQRRVAHERLGLDVEVVPGGHLAALSQPRAIADRLLAALALRA